MKKIARAVRLKTSASICPIADVSFSFSGPLETTIPILGKMGYNGVELLLKRPDDVDIGVLDNLISKHEMQVSAIGTGLATVDGLSLGSTDEVIRRKTVDRVLGFRRLVEYFNSWVILGSIKGAFSHSLSLLAIGKSMRELKDMRTLLEPLNRYECPFINTALDAIGLIKANDLVNTSILLDTFHMNLEEKSLPDAVRRTGRHLGHVHIADSNRRAPGDGHIQFQEVFNALDEIQYNGFLSAEILQMPDPQSALGKTARFLRTMIRK